MEKTKERAENARYVLPAGTLLDGRYKIRRLIGQGGFGITYEAVHRFTGQRVAVKEYFCREYCGRDITAGGGLANSVYIVDETLAAQFRSDLERFLKEARILHDFAKEPAIVTVLDYFEENGTAYIVMEYLDGVNLRDYVRDRGKWEAERAVRCFEPVMEAMERVHAAGVLHRDISPDNLMYMPDGTLRLLDFGAARRFTNMQTTHSVIFKSYYSAPEQREEKGVMGTWTDVYGLCSTLYFCLTGQEPEDVLARLLYDEMEPPSSLGAEILPQAERVLMKGMALDWQERVQDMGALRAALVKVYPNRTEEEKKKEEERRRRTRRTAAAVAAAVLLVIGCTAWVFRTQILFHFIETQVAVLDGSGMTPAQYADSAAKVRDRVEAMAGRGKYLWQEEGRQIRFEVPAEIFGTVEPQDYVRLNISRQMILRLYVYSEEKQDYEELGILSQTEDVEEVRDTEDGKEVRFTKNARERLGALLQKKGTLLRVTFDELDESGSRRYPYGFQDCVTAGDGACMLIPGQNGTDAYTIPFALGRLHYTQAPSAAAFLVHCPMKAKWEDPVTAMLPGRNQKKESEIPNPSIQVRYSPAYGSDAGRESGYSAELLSFQAVLKNRLDSIGIPYAVGINEYNSSELIIRVPEESVWAEELELLGQYMSIMIGSDRTASSRYIYSNMLEVLETEGGQHVLRASFPEGYDRTSAAEALEVLRTQGKERVWLYAGKIPVACGDLQDALRTLEEDNAILFTHWTDAGPKKPGTPMDASNMHFARFLCESLTQKPQTSYTVKRVEYFDENGLVRYFATDLPENTFRDDAGLLAQQWREKDEYLNAGYDSSLREMSVYIYYCPLEDPAATLRRLTDIYPELGSEEDGLYKISIHMYDQADREKRQSISLVFEESFVMGTKKIDYGFVHWNDPVEAEKICAAYNRYLRETAPWDSWIDPDSEEDPLSVSQY